MGQNFIGQKLPQMVHNIESAKVEMLETELNLERNMVIPQGIQKILTPYCKLQDG